MLQLYLSFSFIHCVPVKWCEKLLQIIYFQKIKGYCPIEDIFVLLVPVRILETKFLENRELQYEYKYT